jgi:eukaryotic-like serine/threonine-protein kinase
MTQQVDRQNLSVEALVSEVVDEFMQRLDREERPDIEEYANRHPTIANVLRQVLPALQLVRFSGPVADTGAGLTGCLGDYCLGREIGRGGMGVVYEAEQISLHRRVALKVLPFAAALDARQLQRFKNEAQAAAHLHHQNIVPVYAVGCERGVHYYTMQFIEGQTLAAAIEALKFSDRHTQRCPTRPTGEGDTRPLAERTLRSVDTKQPTREIVHLAVQAADALEYAHQMGIVHRDIKPANLLLDERRNLWITDFGLAHIQGDARLTLTGDLVGTMRYMSPEQALGRGHVDHRTDIYSLGATLFELLALKPVFDGRDRQELLRQIAFEEPRPLRAPGAAIPAELETIVLKALNKEPPGRYARAKDLADDLRRFLEDKPIHARRPTIREKTRKWARRHRPVVVTGLVSAAILMLAGIVGLAAYTIEIRRERDEKKVALEAAETQRMKAEANLHRALDAIERMLQQVNDESIFHGREAEKVRLKISSDALDLCEQLLQVENTGPSARYCTARAYFLAGTLRFDAGQVAEAEDSFRRALTYYRELAGEYPITLYQTACAVAAREFGVRLFMAGRHAEAERLYREAVALFGVLIRQDPADGDLRANLAETISRLAYVLWSDDRVAEAETQYREARRVAAELHDDPSGDKLKNWPGLEAEILTSLGLLQRTGGRFVDAERSFGQALALAQKPGFAGENQTARAHGHLGVVQWHLGRVKAAEEQLRLTMHLREELVKATSGATLQRQELALIKRWLAQCLTTSGKTAAAEKAFHEAMQIQQELADRSGVAVDRWYLALSQSLFANLLRDTGRVAEAEPLYAKSLTFFEEYVAAQPANADRHLTLGLTAENCGRALMAGNPSAAAAAFRKAQQALGQAVRLSPQRFDVHHSLARFLVQCPDPQFRDISRGLEEGQKAVALGKQAGSAWNTVGLAYYRAGRPKEAIVALEKAMAFRDGGNSFDWFVLALAHRLQGNQAEAQQFYDRAALWMLEHQPQNLELLNLAKEAEVARR